MSDVSLFIALAFGYLLGSIPFGLIFTRLAGLGDIRSIGSGNIGSTNVLRTGRKDIAALTLVCDALKGTLPVLVAWHFWGLDEALLAGLGAFFGHLFPVWLKFRGGKGVATFIGVLLGIAWPVVFVFMGVWLLAAYLTRYSSVGGMLASASVPPALWLMQHDKAAMLFAVLAVAVILKHHENIARLRAGTESKIGARKDK